MAFICFDRRGAIKNQARITTGCAYRVQDVTAVNINWNPNQQQMGARRFLDEALRQHKMGNHAQAEAILQRLLAANPREVEAQVGLGIVAAETGRRDIAVQRMKQALTLEPRYLPALRWLFFLLIQSRRTEEARECGHQIASLDPYNAVLHADLARTLSEQGFYAEAIPYFEKAIELDSSNPTFVFALADAYLNAGRDRDAVDMIRKGVAMAPDPAGLVKLAYMELGLGNVKDAEKYCKQALGQEPPEAFTHILMARILTEQLKFVEAENYWKRAAELAPEPGVLSLQRALSLNAIGQFDDAITELQRSIQAKPNQGASYQVLVYAKRIGQQDIPLVRQMENLLSESALNDNERLNILYSLGKSYDNLGDFEKAMGYFDEANGLKKRLRGSQTFDRSAFSALIDAKIRLFSREFYAASASYGVESALPLAVVGMIRSGTTLVEQILSCHPKVGGAGEQRYWGDNDEAVVDYQLGGINQDRLAKCSSGYLSLLRSVAPGYPHVVDKNPLNCLVLGSMHLAFPNMRIIHTRRNAIDTALSIWMTPMSTRAEFVSDRENIVFAYKEYLRLVKHFREILPEDRFLDLRYEDLVSQPDSQVRRLVGFCGLEWDESCLHPELNTRRIKTPSFWQVRQPIYKSSTDRWRKYEPWLGVFEELADVE